MPPLSLILSLLTLAFNIVDDLPGLVETVKGDVLAARAPDSPGGEVITLAEFAAITADVGEGIGKLVLPGLARGTGAHLPRRVQLGALHLAVVTALGHAVEEATSDLPPTWQKDPGHRKALSRRIGGELATFLRPHIAHLVGVTLPDDDEE